MKNSPYDPYLYNPNNPYLSISSQSLQSTPSAQLPTQELRSSQEASEPPASQTFSQRIAVWLYSHLDYCFITVFLFFVLLMIKLLFSIIVF